MNFENGHMLWLLVLFPTGLTAFFFFAYRRRQQLLTRFISARLLPGLLRGISPQLEFSRMALIVFATIALILALARPQWGFEWEEVHQRGLDIVVAIDTSKSMLAEDIAPNRLERAKLAALDLQKLAKSDRLGLVAFAGSAFLQCPLTIDDSAFEQSVKALDVNVISEGGTALSSAIETALAAFKEADNFKALILLTDGEDQEPGATDAAEKAAKAGLKIFTVGIGSANGEVLRITDAKGRTDYIRDQAGNPVNSRLNEDLLRKIAEITKGAYLPLKGPLTMETIYQQGLAPMPKSDSEQKLVRHFREQFKWPLAFAFLLLLLEMLLPERKSSRRSRTTAIAPTVSNKPELIAASMLIFLFLASVRIQGSPSSALRQYQAGHYDKAYEEYKQLSEKNNEYARLHFNAGASAYRNKQYDAAEKEFNEALSSPDLRLQQQAYYNRGNAFYRLGEALPDPQKKIETWKKSLSQYESTLQLNPNDPDAKNNHDYVQRLIEQLQQQQQQQQQQDKDKKDDNKDQKNQQNQNQNQPQNDKSKDQNQDQKDQQQQQQQGSKDDQQDKKDASGKDQKQDSKQNDQKDKKELQQAAQDQQPAPDKPDSKPEEKEPPEQASAEEKVVPGEMSQQEAKRLLDNQKSRELLMPAKTSNRQARANRVIKDW